MTSETLLVTSGGNDLTEVFLHIVFVALKSLLVGDIDTILGRIVVGNAGAVTTDRNEVVTDLLRKSLTLMRLSWSSTGLASRFSKLPFFLTKAA